MPNKNIKTNLYRSKGKNLITSYRIRPEFWHISPAEAKAVLIASGCDVKEIKKIRLLKYKVCISYWNCQGGVCSGFFSYRLFATWQEEVEQLIANCPNFKRWQLLNRIMKQEFIRFPYSEKMIEAINSQLQNRLYVLKTIARQTASGDVGMSSEWEYFESVILNS